MGLTTSCGGGCGRTCGKSDTKASSRVDRSRQDYEYPADGKTPDEKGRNAAFVEEQIQPDAWVKDSREDPGKEDLGSPRAINGMEGMKDGNSTPGTAADTDAVKVSVSPDGTNLFGKVVKAPDGKTSLDEEDTTVPADRPDAVDPASPSPRERMSWKKAAKKALLAKNMGAKIAIENKIGKKLEGWFRDVALELQRGIAADGRQNEHPNFVAPEGQLFARARAACGLAEARYFAIMGLQDGLTEPNLALIGGGDAAGKSGSFFFLSPDQQLIAKSCTKEDWDVLLRILPEYVEYFEAARAKAVARAANEVQDRSAPVSLRPDAAPTFVKGFTDTLLPRFLGLYKLSLPGDSPKEPCRVLLMANAFGGAMSIDRRYDLKGSTHGRKASRKECAKKAPTFKDIDWVAKEAALRLSEANRVHLMKAIELDLAFLAKNMLMDYSLLVGVHDIPQGTPSTYEAMNVVTVRDSKRHCYIGIIDVLTPYKMKKRAETFFLGTVVCGRDVSCQHPRVYARRFHKFTDEQVFDHKPLETSHRKPTAEENTASGVSTEAHRHERP